MKLLWKRRVVAFLFGHGAYKPAIKCSCLIGHECGLRQRTCMSSNIFSVLFVRSSWDCTALSLAYLTERSVTYAHSRHLAFPSTLALLNVRQWAHAGLRVSSTSIMSYCHSCTPRTIIVDRRHRLSCARVSPAAQMTSSLSVWHAL